MAQTKKAASRRSSSSSKSNGSSDSKSAKASKSSNGASRAKSSNGSSKSKSQASKASKTKSQSSKTKSQAAKKATHASSNGAGSPSAVKDAVKNGAQGAAEVVRKAKVPLVASGAAVAGVAGAVVMSRSGKRHKVLGVSVPKRKDLPKVKVDARKIAGAVTDAAKRADSFGQRVSSVANSVQKVGETASDAAKKA